MEKQPKVSVIIPVYNVEQYLSRCLDSVISQNFNDMEIICINDGSKDASLRILEEYAGKDSRIVIIDKKNAGVSAARNDGIAAAKGEYLAFLDGDDFWEADCLAKIYQEAEHNHSDIVIFAHNLWENDLPFMLFLRLSGINCIAGILFWLMTLFFLSGLKLPKIRFSVWFVILANLSAGIFPSISIITG